MQQTRTQRPRFWLVLQPTIVRLYKIAGLIALSAILIGLISFLVSSVFYFFDHSWVRPMRIDAQNQKVIDASKELTAGRKELGVLQADKLAIESELDGLKQAVTARQKYITDVGTAVDAPKAPDQWVLRHYVDQAKLDIITANSKQPALQLKLDNIKQRIEEQDAIVKRLEQSPYLKALKQPIVLAFVPNSNDVKPGTKLYGCSWGLVNCSNVGKVIAIYDGEVTDSHPHNNSVQRGHLVEIDVSPAGANDTVLFADGKPLWLF